MSSSVALVAIAQAATSTLQRDEILNLVVHKISEVVPVDRCSVVLVEDEGGLPRKAEVVASQECPEGMSLSIELGRYPELKKALVTRETVLVEDAQQDPLMADVKRYIAPLSVRSILVHPLVSQDDVWREFQRLRQENRALAIARIRDACGFAPVPHAARIERWLECNAHDFAAVIRPGVARPKVLALNLTSTSPDA